jgi:hypothetical protein
MHGNENVFTEDDSSISLFITFDMRGKGSGKNAILMHGVQSMLCDTIPTIRVRQTIVFIPYRNKWERKYLIGGLFGHPNFSQIIFRSNTIIDNPHSDKPKEYHRTTKGCEGKERLIKTQIQRLQRRMKKRKIINKEEQHTQRVVLTNTYALPKLP